MTASGDASRQGRRIVGAVAVALIVVLFLLWFFRVLGFLEWIILVVVVWLIANYFLRRMKRQQSW